MARWLPTVHTVLTTTTDSRLLYCTVQYTVLYSTVQYIQYIQYCTVLYSMLQCTVQYCTVLSFNMARVVVVEEGGTCSCRSPDGVLTCALSGRAARVHVVAQEKKPEEPEEQEGAAGAGCDDHVPVPPS